MTDHVQRGDYLSRESGGQDLPADERIRLDRVREQLGSEALWDEPNPDGQFRLLAAAAAEASAAAGRDDASIDLVAPTPIARPKLESIESSVPQTPETPVTPTVRVEGPAAEPISLDERRRRAPRAKWFGAGAVAAAAVAAIAAVSATQFTSFGVASGDDDLFEVAATHRLTATELDPDTIADLDVVPTPAGVQFELRLMMLDNAVGADYYAAWLLPAGADMGAPDTEAIPLGSFHWRMGGVPVILWSGVDDPSFTRFVVTKQTLGDLGVRSDQVVLTGEVPELTAGS